MKKEYKLWDESMPFWEADKPCENRLVAYVHDDDKIRPAIVIYPGGGYFLYGDIEQHPIAQFYYDNGYQAFIAYYRVAPYRHPAPLLDAQRAIKLVRYHSEEWKVDVNRVFAIGFSAGGHLCGCVASMADACATPMDAVDRMDCRPTGAILSYPVVTADPSIAHMGSFSNLLGEAASEKSMELSLENLVNENTSPCFVWHTLEDTCVNSDNSLVYAKAMKQAGRPLELHLFQKGEHGSGLATEIDGTNQWPTFSLRWMEHISENK